MNDAERTVTSDIILELFGIGPEAERLNENIAIYRELLHEIARLRALDMTDIHPAVVFDPSLPYRGA